MNISFIFVLGSFIAITILSYLCFRKSSEGFCNCFPIRDKRCPDPKVLTDLYNSGELTEFTDFSKKEGSPPGWKIAMPEDMFSIENNS
jgi:hypothetical protein